MQVICPIAYDQWQWGERLSWLGVAPPALCTRVLGSYPLKDNELERGRREGAETLKSWDPILGPDMSDERGGIGLNGKEEDEVGRMSAASTTAYASRFASATQSAVHCPDMRAAATKLQVVMQEEELAIKPTTAASVGEVRGLFGVSAPHEAVTNSVPHSALELRSRAALDTTTRSNNCCEKWRLNPNLRGWWPGSAALDRAVRIIMSEADLVPWIGGCPKQ